MAEQLSGSLLRCEQGSIDEYIAAPRNSAPAASAFFTASLLGVVRGRGFVRMPREARAGTRNDHGTHTIRGGARHAFAALVDGLPQVLLVAGRQPRRNS